MKKLILCRTATILCGLLAIAIHSRPDMTIGHLPNGKLIGAALGLLSAIFGSQWIEYQKRQEATSNQSGWPTWVRRLLFSSLLCLTGLTATAQTNWTARPQSHYNHSLGDVAYGAGRYVAVGDYGIIRVSTDGESWTTQADGQSQSNSLFGIIYANNQFVAVGNNGRVMTSPNGLTWTTQVSGTNEALSAIAYGDGKFVAVGWKGVILTSTDGVTWTNQVSGTPYIFTDVAYGGGKFVAVGQYGLVKTSTDGVTWIARTLPVSGFDLRGVTAGPNGSFVAVGGLTTVVTSTDGITWTLRPVAGPSLFLTDVAYNSKFDRYVATSNVSGKLVTSIDGITWNPTSSGTPLLVSGVRCLQNKFLIVGSTIRSSSTIQWSVGSIWKPVTIDPLFSLHGAAFGNGHYVAVGAYSPVYYAYTANVAVTSADGINYTVGETYHFPTGDKQFTDVAFGNGLFVAVGEDAIIQTSVDGKVWDFRQVVAGQMLNAVTFGGGQFVAIGTNGYICRSSDGKTWSQGFMGLAKNFNGISYANGKFTAVGQYGAIATSSNGLVWTIQPPVTDKMLKSVAYGNGRWIAVGYEGVVLYRIDGLPWLGMSMGYGINFNHVLFANGQFVAVGLSGKIYTSPDGIVWKPRASGTTSHLWSIMQGANQFVAVGEPTSLDDWSTAIVVTSPNNNPATANAQPTSPTPDAQARVAAEEAGPEVRLQAMTYPNPVEEDFTVTIEGASGQQVRLWLVDGQGRTVSDKQIRVEESEHNESMRLGQREPGMYLLRVSTAGQTKTLKILKR